MKAGKAIESVKNPEANVSSHMIPRVNSIARMPNTKAFSTDDRSDLAFCLIQAGGNKNLQRPSPGVKFASWSGSLTASIV
jgi:hypothetical protein